LLNNAASELASMVGVRAATDITGFGLIGHGIEMAEASDVDLEINLGQVPFLSGAREYAEMGTFPGGTIDNQRFFRDRVEFAEGITIPEQRLLFDAQTSGGLLMAVPNESIEGMEERAGSDDIQLWRIGTVRDGSGSLIVRK